MKSSSQRKENNTSTGVVSCFDWSKDDIFFWQSNGLYERQEILLERFDNCLVIDTTGKTVGDFRMESRAKNKTAH